MLTAQPLCAPSQPLRQLPAQPSSAQPLAQLWPCLQPLSEPSQQRLYQQLPFAQPLLAFQPVPCGQPLLACQQLPYGQLRPCALLPLPYAWFLLPPFSYLQQPVSQAGLVTKSLLTKSLLTKRPVPAKAPHQKLREAICNRYSLCARTDACTRSVL